jgi:hypothetical protein
MSDQPLPYRSSDVQFRFLRHPPPAATRRRIAGSSLNEPEAGTLVPSPAEASPQASVAESFGLDALACHIMERPHADTIPSLRDQLQFRTD